VDGAGSVASRTESRAQSLQQSAFVIMPFKDEFLDIYMLGQPRSSRWAHARKLGARRVRRADEVVRLGNFSTTGADIFTSKGGVVHQDKGPDHVQVLEFASGEVSSCVPQMVNPHAVL
jgi:hypothetical protein